MNSRVTSLEKSRDAPREPYLRIDESMLSRRREFQLFTQLNVVTGWQIS
jgi:hypothetical protein